MTELVPRVSVLMAVHNSAPYVEKACRSILQQSLRDLELVVIDDGSSDDSPRRLRAISSQDSRVRLVAREDRGLIATRNDLLSMARAELIAWMDSDDLSVPERLAQQVVRFDADPWLVCLGGALLEIDPEGEPICEVRYPLAHPAVAEGMQRGGGIRFPTTMMRRQAAIGVGGFREPFKMGEDFDLLLRLMDVGSVANLPDVLLHYRQHPRSTSRQLSSRWAVYRDAILELAQERHALGHDRLQRGEALTLAFPPDLSPADLRWDAHVRWARQALASTYLTTAQKHARRAIRIAPHRLASWKLGARVLLTTLRKTAAVRGKAGAEQR
jgi:GT2 family glycosyltransferase